MLIPSVLMADGNYVFGGFTAAKWNSSDSSIADTKESIFSVSRKGISCNNKFIKKDTNYAIYGHPSYGPKFGPSNN
jgi:hypothetical protein